MNNSDVIAVSDGKPISFGELKAAIAAGMRTGFAAAEQERRDAEMQLAFDELVADVCTGRLWDSELIDERLHRACKTREQLRDALERFDGRKAPRASGVTTRLGRGIQAR